MSGTRIRDEAKTGHWAAVRHTHEPDRGRLAEDLTDSPRANHCAKCAYRTHAEGRRGQLALEAEPGLNTGAVQLS